MKIIFRLSVCQPQSVPAIKMFLVKSDQIGGFWSVTFYQTDPDTPENA
jgi:hypothetical protein